MDIKVKPMGPYQTNCYIVTTNGVEIIIDPGVGATPWVLDNITKPVAILNTHGHFDHVWSNQELKEILNIPLYTPKDDVFLLQSSSWVKDLPPSYPDVKINGDEKLDIHNIQIYFRHFPGHTPGCSTIEINDAMFSGDFIFKDAIGRVDFQFSNPSQMKESLKKFAEITYDKIIYPGHGEQTSIKEEQRNISSWL